MERRGAVHGAQIDARDIINGEKISDSGEDARSVEVINLGECACDSIAVENNSIVGNVLTLIHWLNPPTNHRDSFHGRVELFGGGRYDLDWLGYVTQSSSW